MSRLSRKDVIGLLLVAGTISTLILHSTVQHRTSDARSDAPGEMAEESRGTTPTVGAGSTPLPTEP